MCIPKKSAKRGRWEKKNPAHLVHRVNQSYILSENKAVLPLLAPDPWTKTKNLAKY